MRKGNPPGQQRKGHQTADKGVRAARKWKNNRNKEGDGHCGTQNGSSTDRGRARTSIQGKPTNPRREQRGKGGGNKKENIPTPDTEKEEGHRQRPKGTRHNTRR